MNNVAYMGVPVNPERAHYIEMMQVIVHATDHGTAEFWGNVYDQLQDPLQAKMIGDKWRIALHAMRFGSAKANQAPDVTSAPEPTHIPAAPVSPADQEQAAWLTAAKQLTITGFAKPVARSEIIYALTLHLQGHSNQDISKSLNISLNKARCITNYFKENKIPPSWVDEARNAMTNGSH